MKKITAIGNAIVDIVCKIDDQFLLDHKLIKGSMSLIDENFAEKLSKLKIEKITSGGSAGNTIAALAQLDVETGFIGKVAKDDFGKKYIDEIEKTSCKFLNQNKSQKISAKSFILITPDAQRTMCTFLGCASEITEEDIDEDVIKNSSILYLEGYLWDSAETILSLKKAINLAKKHQVKIAFSLSDSFCVSRHKKDFLQLIKSDLDLLFANEAEVVELLDMQSFSIEKLKFNSDKSNFIAALTRSQNGCIILQGEKYFEVSASKIDKLVDTTGAGDSFAAGFLYGLVNDFNLEKSARLANQLAGKIIQKIGARFEKEEILL
jgi:fructokinase